MSRPEPPRTVARPTLFSAARGSRPDATLRMLAPHPPRPEGPRFALRGRRVWMAIGALLLVAAGGATLIAGTGHRPSAPSADRPRPVLQPAPVPLLAAPAVIESIAPAPREAAAPPPALATPRAQPGPAKPAPRQRLAATPPARAPLATADADVDLLAAMVTRLQAADAAADPCRAGEPAPVGCPVRHDPAAVPRAAAR